MPPPPAPHGVFDPADLASHGLLAGLVSRLLDDPQWLFGLLRRHWPIPRVPFTKWAMVTLFEDVQEVLTQNAAFEVPFGDKVKALSGGQNFILGMSDGPDYQRCRRQILQAFRRDDVAAIVTPVAARLAGTIVGESGGTLDAVQDLITLVPTQLCEHYYGVPVPDERAFAQWTIAMSTFMFGDPANRPSLRRAGRAASDLVHPIIAAAIAAAKARLAAPRDTVLDRLVAAQDAGAEGLTDEAITSNMVGMISGFVPTNTMAAGNMLEMLFRRPDFMAAAQAAARAGDDALLQRCLFEAMRFKPLNLGPFRRCVQDYTVAKGTRRQTTLRAGTNVIAGTQSAMFDERRVKDPTRFDPDRTSSEYMLFGFGQHWCIGAYAAQAQITQTLKPLLRLGNLRRAPGAAGQLTYFGPFPAHLRVQFDPPPAPLGHMASEHALSETV